MKTIPATILLPMLAQNADDVLPERQEIVSSIADLEAKLRAIGKRAATEYASLSKDIEDKQAALWAAQEKYAVFAQSNYQLSEDIQKEIKKLKSLLIDTQPAYIRHCFQAMHSAIDFHPIERERFPKIINAQNIIQGWQLQALPFSEMQESFNQAMATLLSTD